MAELQGDNITNSAGTGAPTFPFGLIGGSSSNIRASEGAGTTTLTSSDKNTQVFDLTASRIVKLPSAGVKAGDPWTIINPNAFALSIQSSNANGIITSFGSETTITALVDTPVASSDWKVTSKAMLYGTTLTSYTPTFNAGAVVAANTCWWLRTGFTTAKVQVGVQFGVGSTGNFTATTPSGISVATSYYILGSSASLGQGTAFQSPAVIPGFPVANSSTVLGFRSGYNLSAFAAQGLNFPIQPTLNSGDYVEFEAEFIVTEWAE